MKRLLVFVCSLQFFMFCGTSDKVLEQPECAEIDGLDYFDLNGHCNTKRTFISDIHKEGGSGFGKCCIDDKIIWFYSYKNGKIDGEARIYYENGNLKFVGNYKNGLKNGVSKDYYENGQLKALKEYDSEIGKWFHGKCEKWHNNGEKQVEANYYDGYKNGKYKAWYKNGNIKFEGVYRMDTLLNGKSFDENGKEISLNEDLKFRYEQ